MRIRRMLTVILAVVLMAAMCAPALAEYKIFVIDEAERMMDCYSTLKRGSKGQAVRNLQTRLADLGYMSYDQIDGSYGGITETAVYNFCINNFLTGSNGTAYPYTQYKLYDVTAIPAWDYVFEDLYIGDQGAAVLRLEKRLCDTGYLPDEYVDGFYDEYTYACVYAFQIVNGWYAEDGYASVSLQNLLFSYDMHSCPEEVRPR